MLKNVNLKRLFAQQTKKGIKPAPETLLKIKAMTLDTYVDKNKRV